MSAGLTPLQADLLDLLRSSPRTPSYAEITRSLGLSSKSAVFRLVNALHERGYIDRLPNRSRAIRLRAQPKAWLGSGNFLSDVDTVDLASELRRRGFVVGKPV
jgi:repressor LexA